MEMPRSFSIAIQSEVTPRRPALPCTAPAVLIAAACSASASVSVDLPASGWLITANVRRRAASSRTAPLLAGRFSTSVTDTAAALLTQHDIQDSKHGKTEIYSSERVPGSTPSANDPLEREDGSSAFPPDLGRWPAPTIQPTRGLLITVPGLRRGGQASAGRPGVGGTGETSCPSRARQSRPLHLSGFARRQAGCARSVRVVPAPSRSGS